MTRFPTSSGIQFLEFRSPGGLSGSAALLVLLVPGCELMLNGVTFHTLVVW